MKREIKFRYWDADINMMFPIDEWSSGDRVMQFTGIKDKQGKDIYEGDIILLENEEWAETIEGFDRVETSNIIAEVIFQNGCFGALSGDEGTFESFETILDCYDKPEIIGNIYESPELIR